MYEIYQIASDDTIDSIADQFGTTVDELEKINKTLFIELGQNIIVPAINNNILQIYRVKKGDTPFSVAQQYNMTADSLMALNGLNSNDFIYPDQQLIIPGSNTKVYITKQGDTLGDIKKNLKKNFEEIINQNNKIYLVPDQLIIYKEESVL